MSSNRAVVSSIGFGPSSKDNKISPLATSTVSMECQIVHRCRNLWMKEFRSSGVQEFRSSGVQEFRSSGVQEFRSSGVQEFRSSGVQEFRSSGWGAAVDCKQKRFAQNVGLIKGVTMPDVLNSCNSSNSFLEVRSGWPRSNHGPHDGAKAWPRRV